MSARIFHAVPAVAAMTLAGLLRAPASPAQAPAAAPPAPRVSTAAGQPIDRVVAIVNNDLILDSDVDQELRLEALEPYGDTKKEGSRDEAIDRLINQDLILQQSKLQSPEGIGDEEVTKELDALRKNIPDCKRFDCSTKEGWDRFLASRGFTEASLRLLWRQRMESLAYIEQRFKMGVRITPQEINQYYTEVMLPEYAKQHVSAPKLDTLSDRIQEVLLEQRVNTLLDDWLKSLRAQGSVVVMHPGEAAP